MMASAAIVYLQLLIFDFALFTLPKAIDESNFSGHVSGKNQDQQAGDMIPVVWLS